MEQTMLLGILIASILIICLVVITMIVVITGIQKEKKTLKELSDMVEVMQRQSDSGRKQGRADEALLSEIKGAVSSAVANQMEYEMKQVKQQLDEISKMQENQVQNLRQSPIGNEKESSGYNLTQNSLQRTMIMPEIPSEKAGTILCRNCYKPYPVTENKCPFCQARQNK